MAVPPSFAPRNPRRRPTAGGAHRSGERSPGRAAPEPPTPTDAPRQSSQSRQGRSTGDSRRQPIERRFAGQRAPGYDPFAEAHAGASGNGSGAARSAPSSSAGGAPPAFAPRHPAPPPTRARAGAAWSPRPARTPDRAGAPRPARPRRRAHRLWKTLIVLLIAAIAWPAWLLWSTDRNLSRVDALSGAAGTPGTTYLLAGSDARAGSAIQDGTKGQRSDSIMLVNVAANGQASAISLPRDTYVQIPGVGYNKLNAAYSLGGPTLLVRTVERLTGLTIDRYVEIGMGGLSGVVDAVGGVNLCYDRTVDDAKSQLKWSSGCHDADGDTALAFSRMRYSDPEGDIGRAKRQRQVVDKTVAKATSPAVLLNPLRQYRLSRAGAQAITVDRDAHVLDIARLMLAFRKAGQDGLSGTPPIASLGYATSAGSAVLLDKTKAITFFEHVREGTLSSDEVTQAVG